MNSTGTAQKESQKLPLVSRFQRSRWGHVRATIHGLLVGEEAVLPRRKWNSITTSITRLQDAYEYTRRYTLRTLNKGVVVRRSL